MTNSVDLPDPFEQAVRALVQAARWDLALALLDAVLDPRRPGLTVQAAAALRRRAALDQAFWSATPLPPPRAEAPDGWDAARDAAQAAYVGMLRRRIEGLTPDTAAVEALRADLEHLLAAAPDGEAALAVRFHLGLVHENLCGDAASATPHWTAAADAADTDVAASALRHLGGQAVDCGDHDRARDLWWRSFRLRARDGDLPGALAQLLLLAPSTTLAEAVQVWAGEAGLAVLRDAALHSLPDPT